MIKELDALRELGAQKIYEETHIPLLFVQSVIHESFEGLTKIQFVGFVSILEREYHQDLSILKEKGLEYIDGVEVEEHSDSPVFVTAKPPVKLTGLYVVIALIIFAFVLYNGFFSDLEKTTPSNINNSAINDAKQNIQQEQSDKILDTKVIADEVVDENKSAVEIKNIEEDVKKELVEKIKKAVVVSEKVIIVKKEVNTDFAPLIIFPKSKLWIGYINQISGKKYQKVITKKLEIDPDTTWLLSLGHGYVKIEANSKKFDYNLPGNTRFIYKNGILKHLSVQEFKALNKGRLW